MNHTPPRSKWLSRNSPNRSHTTRALCEPLESRVLLSGAWTGGHLMNFSSGGNHAPAAPQIARAALSRGGPFLPPVNNPIAASGPQDGGDVSSQITVTRGGFRFDRASQTFRQTLTLRNTGADLAGPVVLHLDIPTNGVIANQAYLTNINNIDFTKLLYSSASFQSTTPEQGTVRKTLKHLLVIKPLFNDDSTPGMFAAGEVVTLTVGFRNDLGYTAQQTPAFNYTTSVEQLPASNQLQYAVAADGVVDATTNNVGVTEQGIANSQTKRTILTIANTGAASVKIPDLAVAPDYLQTGGGTPVIFPSPHPLSGDPVSDGYPSAATVAFTTNPSDGPYFTYALLRRAFSSTTAGQPSVPVLSLEGLAPGQPVSGPGISAGTTIQSINGNTLTLSQNATATASNIYLYYGVVQATHSLTRLANSSSATVDNASGLSVGQAIVGDDDGSTIGFITGMNGTSLMLSSFNAGPLSTQNARFGPSIPAYAGSHLTPDQMVAIVPRLTVGPADMTLLNGVSFVQAASAPYAAYLYKFSLPATSDHLPGNSKVVLDLFQLTTPNGDSAKKATGITHVWRKS